MDKVALKQVSFRVLRFSPDKQTSPLLLIHLSLPHEVYNYPDQDAHCHMLGSRLGASSLTWMGWSRSEDLVSYVLGGAVRLQLSLQPLTKRDYAASKESAK